MFDCSKCLEKCRAACCGAVFMPRDYAWIPTARDVVYKEFFDDTDSVLQLAENMRCPFLTEDLECSIHSKKPKVCAEYGCEKDKYTTCPWQDKDGNERSRQERRHIMREQIKCSESFLNKQK